MPGIAQVLLPFVTLKPLEVSLVEAEHAAAAAIEPAQPPPSSPTDGAGAATSSGARCTGSFGPWRTPQRASTSYVRCLYHAVNFILTRRRGVSARVRKRSFEGAEDGGGWRRMVVEVLVEEGW